VRKIASIAGLILGLALGLALIARAVVELFAIDMTNPATYHKDWGGPSLIGVLAVHCGPGLLAAIAIVAAPIRRRARKRATVGGKVHQAS
jgi:hypothetical protein